MENNPSPSLLKSFPRVFWVANAMELFERGAYYGMNSVLAVYLTNSIAEKGLGFTEQAVGFLQSIIYAMTYILPILAGALADQYGYRRILLFAFSFLSAGYFLAGHTTTYGTVFASLLLMATGSGLFKPIITGVVARVTNEKTSGMGFGIYYWMINMGAFLAPLVVSYLKGFSWSYVFIASSIYCGLMLLPTIFLFQDPPKPEKTRTLKEVLSGAAMVLGDARFMLMIFVYSGFWVLYFQTFGSVLWFLRDFIDPTPVNRFMAALGIANFSFESEHVTVINAGIIILLQFFVSRLLKDAKPLPTMVAGIGLGVIGFICLAFTTSIEMFMASIAIFTLGEMTAHPKYYSYIGIVAPSDRKTVYMGYAFLYGIIGSLFGSNLGGAMYSSMLKPMIGQPQAFETARNFWFIFVGLGLLATLGLLLYNHFLAQDTPQTNRTARKIMLAVYLTIVATGAYFCYVSLAGASIAYKTLVQAILMMAIGSGGFAISLPGAKPRSE